MNLAAREQMERQLKSLKDMFNSNDQSEGSKATNSLLKGNETTKITEKFQKEIERENEVLEELNKEMEKLMSKSNKLEFNFDMDMNF